MTLLEARPDVPPSHPPALPPLENGDRLTRAEFERRYHAMPHLKKAELIQGRVYMPSPVSLRGHSRPHFDVISWLGQYRMATPGVLGGDNGSIRLQDENMPQPDAFLMILPECGGRARVSADDYLEGGPELVIEVAASSVSYDLHDKLEVYRAAGVPEYLVWRVLDETLDWRVLRAGRYEPLAPGADGVLRSEVFPGLWLDAAALAAGDLAQVAQVLQQGVATAAHGEFVARLRETRSGGGER